MTPFIFIQFFRKNPKILSIVHNKQRNAKFFVQNA